MGSVSLLARMFSEKGSVLAKNHRQLWLAFLGRYNDISVAIRTKCVQYTMHFLMNHPELVRFSKTIQLLKTSRQVALLIFCKDFFAYLSFKRSIYFWCLFNPFRSFFAPFWSHLGPLNKKVRLTIQRLNSTEIQIDDKLTLQTCDKIIPIRSATKEQS